jgi:hypothetical protein
MSKNELRRETLARQLLHDATKDLHPTQPDRELIYRRAAARRRQRRGLVAGAATLAVVLAAGVSALVVNGGSTQHVTASGQTPTTQPRDTSSTVASPSTTLASPATSAPASPPPFFGDIDGDGIGDRVTIEPTTDAHGAHGAQLNAQLSKLGRRSAPIFPGYDRSTPQVAGVVDMNGDGYGEVIIAVGRGTGLATFIVVTLTSGNLAEVVESSDPLFLPVGRAQSPDGVTGAYGFDCRETSASSPGREVIVKRAESRNGQPFTAERHALTIKGSHVEYVGQPTIETFGPTDESRLATYSETSCGTWRL